MGRFDTPRAVMSCRPSTAQSHTYENTNGRKLGISGTKSNPLPLELIDRGTSALVAETLFLHVLQRRVQAFIVLITKRNKAEGISARTDLRREKFHQAADRA
jgi:hypothetical protein